MPRNAIIEIIQPYLNTPIKDIPQETLRKLFKFDTDRVSKNCKNYGYIDFLKEYRIFRSQHKFCINCGKLYFSGKNRMAPCPFETCKDFFENKKSRIVSQIANTKLERYGDAKYNNREKFVRNSIKKYGFCNPNKSPLLRQKISKIKLAFEEFHKARRKAECGMEYPRSQKHLKNLSNFNTEFIIKNFVKDGFLHKRAALDYFGYLWLDCGRKNPVSNLLKKNGYDYPIYREENYSEKKFLNNLSKTLKTPIQRQVNIFGSRVDGFIEGKKICIGSYNIESYEKIAIEYLGDYFHGNPGIYESSTFNAKVGCSMGILYKDTLKRFDKLLNAGLRIFYIWESEYLKYGLKAIKEYERKNK